MTDAHDIPLDGAQNVHSAADTTKGGTPCPNPRDGSNPELPGAFSGPGEIGPVQCTTPPAFSDTELASAHGVPCMSRITLAEIKKADAMTMNPIHPRNVLRDALLHVGAVVHYGLEGIPDAIDREHLIAAHALLTSLYKAQEAAE